MNRKHLHEMAVELRKSLRASGLITIMNSMISNIIFTQNVEGW